MIAVTSAGAVVLAGRADWSLTCHEKACRGTVRLVVGKRFVSPPARYAAAAGKTAHVTVVLTKALAALLGRAKDHRLVVLVRITLAGGRTTTRRLVLHLAAAPAVRQHAKTRPAKPKAKPTHKPKAKAKAKAKATHKPKKASRSTKGKRPGKRPGKRRATG